MVVEITLYGSRYRRVVKGLTLWGGIWDVKVKGRWRRVRNKFIKEKLNDLAGKQEKEVSDAAARL
jgi:hypothetical protein